MKQCIKKEFKIMLRQKSFLGLVLLFTIAYCIVGIGICNVDIQDINNKRNLLFYYMYVYPIAFVTFMLQFYPIAKDISELSNGGIENLLCTSCKLSSIIMGKTICLFGALMFPPAVMVLMMGVISKMWLMSMGALLLVLPMVLGSISLLHISLGLKKRFHGNSSRANYISIVIMLCLTYFPVITEKVTGHIVDYRISIMMSILLAIVTLILGIIGSRKINVESII